MGKEAVLRLFKSKGLDLELLPRSKPDGKVTHTRVVVGGRWKTAPKDGDGAATLPSEEGTFDQFVAWFDKEFAISPGTTPWVKWKFLRTYCQRTHSISDEELEEFVNSRGGQIVSADDPANPQKCTMVRGIMWHAPPSSTNRLHLTCTDPEVSQGQPKDEAGEEVAEDEGKAEDDSDNEMFQTSKEAVRSYRDKGFRFKHTESELCRAMCCTSRPLKGPCGPCPALAKVRRDTSSKGQWYVDVITPHTDDCPHHTDFKVRGAWLHGGVREIIQTEYFEHRKTPMEIASWHSMRLYRPPFTCGQCNRAVYLWCIYDGCTHCLVGLECLARRFKDRDEVKWVLQKWEKEVDAETILHPTPSVNRVPPNSIPSEIAVGTHPTPSVNVGVAACDNVASTPLDPIPPSSIPSEIVVATPCTDSPPTSHTGCRPAEQILANVCKALSDSHGSFRPSLAEVEALLGDDWGPPLHATVPGPSAQ